MAAKKKSGTSRTYAARRDAGRPNLTFSLSSEVDVLIDEIARVMKTTRSKAVEASIRRYVEDVLDAPAEADPLDPRLHVGRRG